MATAHKVSGERASPSQECTLWVGGLSHQMDETYLEQCLVEAFPHISSIEVCRDRDTGVSRGFAFLKFHSRELAEEALNLFTSSFPNMKFNWAFYRSSNRNKYPSVYVGNLDASLTKEALLSIFQRKFPSANWATVVCKNSIGFGFVEFRDPVERDLAIKNMDGYLTGRRRISVCLPKADLPSRSATDYSNSPKDDAANTTVYVGPFQGRITEQFLRNLMLEFGMVDGVIVSRDGSYGFVTFADKESAVRAIKSLHRVVLPGCKKAVYVSWAKNPKIKTCRDNISQYQLYNQVAPSVQGVSSIHDQQYLHNNAIQGGADYIYPHPYIYYAPYHAYLPLAHPQGYQGISQVPTMRARGRG